MDDTAKLTRGKRKFVVALVSIVALSTLALLGKLDAVAAGAIGGVLALYNHANLKAKEKS